MPLKKNYALQNSNNCWAVLYIFVKRLFLNLKQCRNTSTYTKIPAKTFLLRVSMVFFSEHVIQGFTFSKILYTFVSKGFIS